MTANMVEVTMTANMVEVTMTANMVEMTMMTANLAKAITVRMRRKGFGTGEMRARAGMWLEVRKRLLQKNEGKGEGE